VALHEDFHAAFVNQQHLTLAAELCNTDRGLGEADDDTWAVRMILHGRDALAFSIEPTGTDVWNSLVEYCQQWDLLKPESFSPIYFSKASPLDEICLPEIYFLNDCYGSSAWWTVMSPGAEHSLTDFIVQSSVSFTITFLVSCLLLVNHEPQGSTGIKKQQ
jgi:hypothetical protein